jgi:hypothetical protein
LGLDLPCRVERRLLAREPRRDFILTGLDRGAAVLDHPLRLRQSGRGNGDRLGRDQRSGQSCALSLGFGAARLLPGAAVGKLPAAPIESGTARFDGGGGFGFALQCGLGRGEGRRRFVQPSRCELLGWTALCFGGFKHPALFRQAAKRRRSLGKVRILAFDICGELGPPPFGLGARGEDPLQLLLEASASMGQPLQLRCGRGIGEPQRRECRLGVLASPPLGEGALGRFGDGAFRGAKLAGRTFRLDFGRKPARAEQQCFGPPDVLRETAIALCLTRVLFQGLELGLDRGDDVVEPREVVLGRA